ncbi:MAG: hypothetical protein A2V98_12475 [Planctomycetes bacterium RBG_16_64_12]|nr:MAG: hypothetical protein A2V98_12475 [Planctomycetes bacterium RBG_16_64_12]
MWLTGRAKLVSSGPFRGSTTVTTPSCSRRPCPGEKIDTTFFVSAIGLASIITVLGCMLP